jgi:hypothetical protein
MSKRICTAIERLATFFAIALLGAAPASSQPVGLAALETPENWSAPRTPWGDPDLQGNLTNLYEVNVPLEKPEEFADRAWDSFSREEIATIRTRQQKDAEQRRLTAPGVQGGTPEVWLNAYEHTRGSVLWFVTDPPDGKVPPLTPQGLARQEERQLLAKLLGEVGTIDLRQGLAESIDDRSLYDRCISRGLPGSMMPAPYGNSYQIVQTPGYVAIRYEMIHETRIIPLDGRPHLPAAHALWMGDARGRFEGDTLVVETTNFRPDLTPRGANPATLRLTEKFTRVAPDKILWSMTFDDPDTWTRPWTHTMPLTIDDSQAIIEYACHEGNYAMWNTLTGRRREEHEAAKHERSGR